MDSIEISHPRRSATAVALKRIVQALFLVLISPRLLVFRLTRALLGDRAFLAASESIARIPGLRGVYSRQQFYRHTLAHCGQDIYFGWESTFSMHQARVGSGTYIGRRCSIGFGDIGEDVMLADGVQILSGGHEHGVRSDANETHKEQRQTFTRVRIGNGAWLGTNAIIMADVGAHAIIGAGAVVTRAIPDKCLAVGSPARVVRTLE